MDDILIDKKKMVKKRQFKKTILIYLDRASMRVWQDLQGTRRGSDTIRRFLRWFDSQYRKGLDLQFQEEILHKAMRFQVWCLEEEMQEMTEMLEAKYKLRIRKLKIELCRVRERIAKKELKEQLR